MYERNGMKSAYGTLYHNNLSLNAIVIDVTHDHIHHHSRPLNLRGHRDRILRRVRQHYPHAYIEHRYILSRAMPPPGFCSSPNIGGTLHTALSNCVPNSGGTIRGSFSTSPSSPVICAIPFSSGSSGRTIPVYAV